METKWKIAECFISLVEGADNPSERITVTDVVRSLGIDRKTFYNHFDNTADLVIWIFRDEVADMLQGSDFADSQLSYPSPMLEDKYRMMPFYARFYKEPNGLDQGRYFQALCGLLESRHEYYKRIFTYSCYLDFYTYLISLFVPALKHDVIYLADGRRLTEQQLLFLAEYHTIGILGRAKYYYSQLNEEIPQIGLDMFWNYSHETIALSIKELDIGR